MVCEWFCWAMCELWSIWQLHLQLKDDVTFTYVWHQMYSNDGACAFVQCLWMSTTDCDGLV